MKRYDQRKDQIESEALDGILLLKNERVTKKPILASLNGIGRKEWIFDIDEYKFSIKDGKSKATFFYFVIEKTWFIYYDSGSVKINGNELKNAALLRNGTIIDIGSLSCFFEVKLIIRKEYKKLLVEIILGTMEKKMSLSKIYEKLSEEYGFSQEKKLSWKNSIRCVLSESKVFYKIPKTSKRGRGCYWSVNQDELDKMDSECIKRSEKKFSDSFSRNENQICYTSSQIMGESGSSDNEKSSDEYIEYDYIDDVRLKRRKREIDTLRDFKTRRTQKKPTLNYMRPAVSKENALNCNFEEYEVASFDGGNRHNDAFIEELSSEFSCLSMKQKKRRKK